MSEAQDARRRTIEEALARKRQEQQDDKKAADEDRKKTDDLRSAFDAILKNKGAGTAGAHEADASQQAGGETGAGAAAPPPGGEGGSQGAGKAGTGTGGAEAGKGEPSAGAKDKQKAGAETPEQKVRRELEEKLLTTISGIRARIKAAKKIIDKIKSKGVDVSAHLVKYDSINSSLKEMIKGVIANANTASEHIQPSATNTDLIRVQALLDAVGSDGAALHQFLADLSNALRDATQTQSGTASNAWGGSSAGGSAGASSGSTPPPPPPGGKGKDKHGEDERNEINALRQRIESQFTILNDCYTAATKTLLYIKSKLGDEWKNDKSLVDAGNKISQSFTRGTSHRADSTTETDRAKLRSILTDIAKLAVESSEALRVLREKESELRFEEKKGEREEREKERAEVNKKLEDLKEKYDAKRKEYDKFFGAVNLFQRVFNKDQLQERKAQLDAAKKAYEDTLKEYKGLFLESRLQEYINDVNNIIAERHKDREAKSYLNIYAHWKKTGLARLGISGALLGAGLFFGAGAEAQTIMSARNLLSGASAGFGLFGLMLWGKDALRKNFGLLKNLKAADIEKLPEEKLLQYIAAREVYAEQKNIDIQTDGTYLALLERFQRMQGAHFNDLVDDKLAEVDKKIAGMKRAELATNMLLAFSSTAIGVATGLGWVSQALHGSHEAAVAIKALQEKTALLQKASEAARGVSVAEAAQNAGTAATEAVTNNLQGTGYDAKQIIDAKNSAIDAATKAAKEKLHTLMTEVTEKISKGQIGKENIDQALSDAQKAAEQAGQEAADRSIHAAQQAAEAQKAAREAAEAAEQAAREAALAAGKGAGAATQDAADAGFRAMPKFDQAKKIYDSILDATQQPGATDDALKKIAQERLSNKEFKNLAEALADTKADYAESVTKKFGGDWLKTLTNTVQATDKLSLEQYENLRNMASWHDTPLGQAAHKLLLYVENPDHHVLQTSHIEQIEITKDKPLFEAFSEAEHKLGITDAATIDKNFATLLEHYGVDAINEKGAINADILKAAKDNIKHVGETLWYSKDGDVIASQEIDMMDDEFESQPEQPTAQEAAPAKKLEKTAAKAQGKVVDNKGPDTAARDVAVQPGTQQGTDSMQLETGGATAGLPKGWEWIKNPESIKNLPIDQIKTNPETFYKHVVKPIIGYYPAGNMEILGIKAFDQETIKNFVLDPQYGKENILQLYNAYIVEERTPITLRLAGEEPLIIPPGKK